MKGFMKPKLILSLVTMILLASAIVVPFAGNIIHSHAAAPATTTTYTQTFTLASCSSSLNFVTVVPTLNKGDVVSGTATLTSSDSAENTQSEDLSLLQPIGSYTKTVTVNSGSQPVSFTETVNGDSLQACIQDGKDGPDSDQTATITVTVTSAPPPSPSPSPSPTPLPSKTLFVFIQGLSSIVNPSDINKPIGFDKPNGIFDYLKSKQGAIGNEDFLEYSYPVDVQGQNQGMPHAYGCLDTFDHSLNQDVRALHLQLLNYLNQHTNQSTNIYLVGDSLGGDIAFGYLGLLRGKGWPSLPNGQLKGVVSLDGLLGGIPTGDKLAAELYYRAKCHLLNPFTPILPLNELEAVFNTTHDSTPFGATANLLHVVFPNLSLPKGFTNQQLADEAAKHSIHTLTIGNTRDFTLEPENCVFLKDLLFALFPSSAFVTVSLSDFRSTQFAKNELFPKGVYSRSVDAGNPSCTISAFFHGNHLETLMSPTVEMDLLNFILNKNP